MIKVLKRDGSLEDYDETKIAKVVKAAGLDTTFPDTIAAEVTKEVDALGVSQVTSLQIRDILVDLLKKVDKNVADMYVWYESTKDGK